MKERDVGSTKPQAQALAKETGITEEQATDLIETLGADKASLVREAKIIKAQSKSRRSPS